MLDKKSIAINAIVVTVVCVACAGGVAVATNNSDSPISISNPMSPNQLLTELGSRGVRAQFSQQYSKPSVPSGVGTSFVLMGGHLEYNNLQLEVNLYSQEYLARFQCEPRADNCVTIGGWTIGPMSPDGMTETETATWRSLKQKIQ